MNDGRYSVERAQNATLSADRVHGKARKIIPRLEQYEFGVSYCTGRLEMNAWCGESIPLALIGRPGVKKIGSPIRYRAIAGEKISYRAKAFFLTSLTKGSSTHKIQECTLVGDVLCKVLRPLIGLH
jgi:hypothetical protein